MKAADLSPPPLPGAAARRAALRWLLALAGGALAGLDFGAALRWNPLVAAGAGGLLALLLLTLARGRNPLGLPERLGGAFATAPRRWLLAAALALNWLYLWFHLPR